MTKFRTGPLPIRPDAWVMTLDEQIAAEARRRANAEARQRFRSEKETARSTGGFRPGATLADDIIAAYKKATSTDDDEDDDKPKDDDPELRGPDQTRIVATADAIIAAMKKAAGEL